MTRLISEKSYPLYEYEDSGIVFDYDKFLMNNVHSSGRTSLTSHTFPLPGMTGRQRTSPIPLITFPSDGIIQRTRLATMKNSENSDFIICQTNRGTYLAHRTPLVPQWIRQLVHEIQLQEN